MNVNYDGLEIELITYNRSEIIENWIKQSLPFIVQNNIALAVYDSSTNDDTERVIKRINGELENFKIKYVHLDSSIRVDEKVLAAILGSEYKYVWPIGDSRLVDEMDFKNKVFPYMQQNYDFICVWNCTMCDNDGRIYTNVVDFFSDCFWHATWLGGLVFQREIFAPLYDKETYDQYLKKYYRNDGFSYLGIFYDLIAHSKITAVFSLIGIKEIGVNKKTAWIKRYLEVWCDNLCYFVDQISEVYQPAKDKVLKETWRVLDLDGLDFCLKARKNGGLSREIYSRYVENGNLDRVTDNRKRVEIFSTWPYPCVYLYWFLSKTKGFLYRRINKLIKRGN